MAAAITPIYNPTQQVYVIADTIDPNNANRIVKSVRPGKIIRIRADWLVTGTTLFYDIQVDKNPGTTPLVEDDVFLTLNAAVTEYETRLV